MKKRYTKKQIQEAISYWKKQLVALNEANGQFTPRTAKLELVFPDPVGNTELAPLTPEVLKGAFGIDPRFCYMVFRLDGKSSDSIVGAKLGQHPTDDAPGSTAIIVDTVPGDVGDGLTYSQFYRKTQGVKGSNAFIVRDPSGGSCWCAEKITIIKYNSGDSLIYIDANGKTDRIA